MGKIADVAGIVRTSAAERPDQEALLFEGRSCTWRDLDERSSRTANALAAAGVGPGDRVARIDKNTPEYFDILFGAAKLNAVTVDVNWRLAPPEMLQIVNDAQAKVLFVGAEFLPHLDKIEGELQSVKTIVVHGDHAAHPSFDAWISEHAATDPGTTPQADDVCLQLYTSGTTGLPKGVMLTNRNLFTFIDEVAPTLGLGPGKVSMVVMPVFHIAGSGWALVSMATGARVVMHREVNPVAILPDIVEHGVTHAVFVPAVLQFFLIVPGVADMDFSSMELIAYGASPITEAVLTKSMELFGCDFVQLYGLTETTGAVVQLDAADHDPQNRPELLRAAGKPYPWVELRIVDENGSDLPEGEVGEVWIKSVQVMKGYWNKPEETAAVMRPGGWFRSGDAGYLRDGYLYLHDRVKDMIVTGGENVYPAEVENALMKHPAVADVGVIGVPDEKWGEAVKAIVVKAEGSDPTPEDIIAFAREHLAGFKVPKSIDFAETLPRNPSGKILKKDLREPYWRGVERRIN